MYHNAHPWETKVVKSQYQNLSRFTSLRKKKRCKRNGFIAIHKDKGKHFAITHHTTICSRHLMDDCLVWTGFAKKRRTLKSNSVTSLFPWNDWGKQLPTPRRLLQRHVCPSQLITSAPLTCTLSTLTPSSGSSNEENIERLDNTETTVNAANCPQEQGAMCSNFAWLHAKLDELQKQNESLQKQDAMLNANSLLLNESISGLKEKTFCLENFIGSDKDMAFYTGLDSERFQILCTLVEAGENGCDVEWYNPQKNIYKEVGLEDGLR